MTLVQFISCVKDAVNSFYYFVTCKQSLASINAKKK